MSYPDPFCVKCQSHTPVVGSRSVVLRNKARAVRGTCPKCHSEVYRILPKKKDDKVNRHLAEIKPQRFPIDAFQASCRCKKCDKKTMALYKVGLLYSSGDRMLEGKCLTCGSVVKRDLVNYRKRISTKYLNRAAEKHTFSSFVLIAGLTAILTYGSFLIGMAALK